MAKGKYAVRAAKARAERSAEDASAVEVRLSAERSEHAKQVNDLKDQINKLQGLLTHRVTELADQAVNEAHALAREQVEAVRAAQHDKAIQAFRFLIDLDLELKMEDSTTICEMLGIDPGEVMDAYSVSNRASRRVTSQKMRKGLEQREQGLTPTLNAPKKIR